MKSGKQLLRMIRAAGFELVSIKGSHYKLRHPDGRWGVLPFCNSQYPPKTFHQIVKKFGLKLGLVAMVLLLSLSALAESPTAVLLYGKGRMAMGRKQSIRAFDDALEVIKRDTGVSIRVTRRRQVKVLRLTIDIPYHGLVEYRETFLKWGGTDITFLIAPPVKDPKQPKVPWLSGVAKVCAARQRWGYAAVHAVKRTAEFKTTAYATAYIAHEVGHILGAGHVWDGSVMNPAGIGRLNRDGSGVVFSPESVGEIYRCQAGWM